MKSKFTLVPSELFSEESARELLSEVVLLEEGEPLSFVPVSSCGAVLIYAGESRPPVFDMLLSLCKISDYNKILASFTDDCLYLVVSQGKDLKFCNCWQCKDFTTAEYYIFMVLHKLQINPQVSSVYFATALSQDEILSLLSYFKNVETLN